MASSVPGYLETHFSLKDRVAIVTGGGGVLGGAMARGLSSAGATIVVIGRTLAKLEATIASLSGDGMAIATDVLDRKQVDQMLQKVLDAYGRVDILVNAAGGNMAGATVVPGGDIFGLSEDSLREVIDLNLLGTIIPTQVIGPHMRGHDCGSIVNITSMAVNQAITRVAGYSAAKAAVENYTRWLATELAQRHGTSLRVNAISPGFFLADQNRRLLTNEDGSLTERGATISGLTPVGRFGDPDELVSTLLWLCGDGAKFITGIVVPVDGGFSAFSGV